MDFVFLSWRIDDSLSLGAGIFLYGLLFCYPLATFVPAREAIFMAICSGKTSLSFSPSHGSSTVSMLPSCLLRLAVACVQSPCVSRSIFSTCSNSSCKISVSSALLSTAAISQCEYCTVVQ